MGDATKKTYNFKDMPERCTIYHAAHHGATSDDSNQEALLARINPQNVVISSHLISKDFHPDPYVEQRALNTVRFVSSS